MADAPPQIHPALAAVLQEDGGILRAFGMQVERAWAGECEILCVVPQAMVNAGGFAHGSMAFSIMDTACAYALRSLDVRGVTLNANVSYVAAAAGGSTLRGRVAVLSRTKRTATLRGEVYLDEDGEQRLAAHGSFVFQLRAGPKG